MRYVSLIVIVACVLALVAQNCMAQCGLSVVWFNRYYGWGNKYAYGAVISENIDLVFALSIQGYTSSYGTTTVDNGGPWFNFSGGRWHPFIVSRGDDTMNYPLQLKVTGSSCGDVVFTSPAAFDLCFFPYDTYYCPMGNYYPYK